MGANNTATKPAFTFEALASRTGAALEIATAYKDLALRYSYCSNRYAALLGQSEPERLIGARDVDLLDGELAQQQNVLEHWILQTQTCVVSTASEGFLPAALAADKLIVRHCCLNDTSEPVGIELAIVDKSLLDYPLAVALGFGVHATTPPLMVIHGSKLLYASAPMDGLLSRLEIGADVREALGLNRNIPLEHQLLAAQRLQGGEYSIVADQGSGDLFRWHLRSMPIHWFGERALLVGMAKGEVASAGRKSSGAESSGLNVVALADYRHQHVPDPYEQLLENSANGVLILSGLRPVYANHAAASLFGFGAREGLLGVASVLDLLTDSDSAKLQILSLYAGDDGQRGFSTELRRRNSVPMSPPRESAETLTVHFAISRVYWRGEPALLCSLTDITEQGFEQQRLRENEARFRDFAESASDFFFELDRDKRLVFISSGVEWTLNLRPDTLLNQPLTEAFVDALEPDSQADFLQHVESLNPRMGVSQLEYRCDDNGSTRYIQQITKPIFHTNGTLKGYRGVCRDTTLDRQLAEQVSYHASHDSLTGLLNRREFEQRMKDAVDNARQSGTTHAVCYVDLDNFKVVNDTCGHAAGDELLRQLGCLLQQKVRRSDALARLGGDEFGILIYHCDPIWAESVASQVRHAVENFLFLWDGNRFSVGASIGVAFVERDTESHTSVMADADEACFKSKESGRNQVSIATPKPVTHQSRQEASWVIRLNRALDDNRFVLFSQNYRVLDKESDQGVHLELLVRMLSREGDIISPQAFMPSAERYGLAPKIDLVVLSKCLEWLEQLPAEELTGIDMCAVNITAHSLRDPRVLDQIVAKVKASSVPARKLCFEISETNTIANLTSAREFISRLSAEGCRFALDDFGSGVSSFQFLRDLPIEFVKIDGIFVQDLVNDEVSQAMVRAISDITHVLGRKTIAESVEDEAQLEKLREYGVNFAQGYVVDRPTRISL